MAGKKKEKPQSDQQVPAAAPLNTGCVASNCGKKADRFGFCATHYEQFKFGLIKKNGEPASDYDKKLEHFRNYQEKKSARKVA